MTEFTLEQALDLLQKAQSFEIYPRLEMQDDYERSPIKYSGKISIEYRGKQDDANAGLLASITHFKEGVQDADLWAIVNFNECYNQKKNKWESDGYPSQRTARFKRETRYSLAEAFEIVYSEKFIKSLRH